MAHGARIPIPTVDDPSDRPFRGTFAVREDFMPLAEADAMRAQAEVHFAEPYAQAPDTHQIWNYWHVPGLYTYLRTQPEKVLGQALADSFHRALTKYATEKLGLGTVSWPTLSLYVDGCAQGLHNDATNGRLGYVYSLTREDRRGAGGETIVFKEGDPFRSRLNLPDAGTGLYDLIEPLFNRLVVFDDRLPHGVQRVEGSMDPMDGRLVLHGHISESGIVVQGPLGAAEAHGELDVALRPALDAFEKEMQLHHGPLTLRLEVDGDGLVTGSRVLLDRVARSDGGSPDALVARLAAEVETAVFPAMGEPSVLIVPIMIGGPLPFARRLAR